MAKLFTAEIDKKLFEQYKFGGDLSKQEVVAKIFNPYGSGTWYLLNSDPQDPDYIWAIVDMFDVEIGSVSRNDLETMKVPPFELHLERDKFFQPMNAQILYLRLRGGEKFEEGGEVSNRISEMVKHWNKCGWASSNINNDDSEFFNRIGKSYIDTANTSFTGNDINYYDADRVEVTTGSFKQKFATGGTTDCGCHKMEEGGSMDYKNKLGLVKVKFKNPKYNYSTNVSATTTEKDARKYFVGQMFNVGSYPREIMREVVDIEFYEKGTYAEGGEIANSNNEMLQSQLKAVEHHAKELSSIVNDKTPVEAWVVGKIERASTDLSDITHYLDGQKFEDGGEIKNQYAGKTAEQVWNLWNVEQKRHFLIDHYLLDMGKDLKQKAFYKKEDFINEYKNHSWEGLPESIKDKVQLHIIQGQYAKGGTIETDTPILVGMVAENVARYKYFEKNNVPKQNQQELVKKADETIAKLEKHLEQKANTVYKNNEMFKKQLNQKGNKGRDALYMYMEHWADAFLGKKYAKGGEISDKFEVGTPAVYHSFDYSNNPKEESGEIVIRDGIKGISLYPNKNYGGSSRNFIVPNWHNVETFYEANERQENDIPFVIKEKEYAKGGEIESLKGRWIDIYFLGVEEPTHQKIKDISVTPERFVHRDISIISSDGSVSKFPLSKLDSFIKGEDIEIKDGKENYIIVLAEEDNMPFAKGGGLSRSQKQYNKEVDAYKYFIVDLKNKKAISGWEFREDANEALSDYDGDKNYKVVAEVTLKSLGIENPKESFKETVSKMAMGGEMMAKGGMMANGGEVMKHKHYDYITIELIEPTNKGWKVKQIETHSTLGKKLSKPKEKIAYFTKDEIKELFQPTMAMGGKVKFSDKVKAVKASLLKTKKVSPKVQKDYGKTYSPKEAEQAAKRIVGSRTAKWNERISNNK
jgi:hypothetical protein